MGTSASGTRAHRHLRRVVLGAGESVAGTVYGTIVVMGVIVAGADVARDAWRLAVIVGATVVVLWVAHVYADAIGESIERARRLDRAELSSVARRELAIPLAAVAPVAALALGALGVVGTSAAVWLALAVGLVTLAVQGHRFARLERLGALATVASVGVNVSLGLTIVALKLVIAH